MKLYKWVNNAQLLVGDQTAYVDHYAYTYSYHDFSFPGQSGGVYAADVQRIEDNSWQFTQSRSVPWYYAVAWLPQLNFS